MLPVNAKSTKSPHIQMLCVYTSNKILHYTALYPPNNNNRSSFYQTNGKPFTWIATKPTRKMPKIMKIVLIFYYSQHNNGRTWTENLKRSFLISFLFSRTANLQNHQLENLSLRFLWYSTTFFFFLLSVLFSLSLSSTCAWVRKGMAGGWWHKTVCNDML